MNWGHSTGWFIRLALTVMELVASSEFTYSRAQNSGEARFTVAPTEILETDKSYYVVDLMVVYSADFADAVEVNQIVALASQGTDYFNTILCNSRIHNVRLRLVLVARVDFRETGNLDHALLWLRESEYIQALRSAVGADLVCLFTLQAAVAEDHATLGKAFYLSAGGQFSVVAYGDQYVMAHELGHNFGCDHALRNEPQGSFAYSHCLSFTMQTEYGPTQFGTVMSQGRPLPYFSNPSVIYTNAFTGGRYMLGIKNRNDNARTVRNTASIVANHMPSKRSLFEHTRSENQKFILNVYGFDPRTHVIEWTDDWRKWTPLIGLVDAVYCDARFYRVRVR